MSLRNCRNNMTVNFNTDYNVFNCSKIALIQTRIFDKFRNNLGYRKTIFVFFVVN